jgi:hypothetical protein
MSLLIFDVNHGDLKDWVALPSPIAVGTHVLTMDDVGQHLFALSSSGLNVIDFTFAPLSISYVQPSSGPASVGTLVTIRGSGFQSASQVLFNGKALATTFVDSQTLSVILPATNPGPMQVSVKNINGEVYALDDGFTAN